MRDSKNSNKQVGSVVEYSAEYKAKEAQLVESKLAPVVRTYEALEEALKSITGKTKVATSGFFNPIHKNHISNIIASKYLPKTLLTSLKLETEVHLTVVVNGDWSTRDKLGGELFMSAEHRADVVRAIAGVDLVFIHEIEWPYQGPLIALGLFDVFTKGGDRDFESLPDDEKKALIETGTIMIGNVGFDKKEGTEEEVSSSKLRNLAKNNR